MIKETRIKAIYKKATDLDPIQFEEWINENTSLMYPKGDGCYLQGIKPERCIKL